MNTETETIGDIIREMRESCERVGCHFNESVALWADRLEAANIRESGDFAALVAERNKLAELNRKCCDDNERLLDLITRLVAIARNRMPSWPTIEESEVLMAAEREVSDAN